MDELLDAIGDLRVIRWLIAAAFVLEAVVTAAGVQLTRTSLAYVMSPAYSIVDRAGLAAVVLAITIFLAGMLVAFTRALFREVARYRALARLSDR